MQELTCNRRAYEISGLLDIPGVAWLEISLIVSVINLVYKNYRYCKLSVTEPQLHFTAIYLR